LRSQLMLQASESLHRLHPRSWLERLGCMQFGLGFFFLIANPEEI